MTPERGHWHLASVFQRKLNVNTGCHPFMNQCSLSERQLEKYSRSEVHPLDCRPRLQRSCSGLTSTCQCQARLGAARGGVDLEIGLTCLGPLPVAFAGPGAVAPSRVAGSGGSDSDSDGSPEATKCAARPLHSLAARLRTLQTAMQWAGSFPAGSHRCS